ncbi:hypothetical protein [Mesomycoplasma ovipneumoniae]|uniref:hypothetical protein n=1 Tax=Mesomycoplasma ovipneumoniae TaxID=29562 RepID=UPI0026E27EB7|nr:hypothetical protein [Mesomycoplasma ovipneumoniae]MDO6829462.1 hypothetical protein [Mesomycoplasma ovipneumoniae]
MDIVKIELNNLPDDVKKEYYKLLTEKLDDLQDWKTTYPSHYLNEDDERDSWDFKDNHTIDELLEVGFRRYPNEFIDFQKKYKDSVYNQTIKKHNFKDLGYKDIVPNLTPKQKGRVIKEISNQDIYLTDEGYEDTKILKIKKKNSTQNRYIIQQNKKNSDIIKEQIFEDDDDFIIFVMEDGRMGHEILNLGREEYLNPHNKVNQWIETKYELEQVLKDNQEQTDKFEAPKLKM